MMYWGKPYGHRRQDRAKTTARGTFMSVCEWVCGLYDPPSALSVEIGLMGTDTGSVGHKWVRLHKKVPYGLSRCHTKRRTGARGRACPSFGMTPTF